MHPVKDQSHTTVDSRATTAGASFETQNEQPFASVVAGQLLGNHRLIRTLGSGGMGVVYVAEDMQTGRLVALKLVTQPYDDLPRFLKPKTKPMVDRFVREVQTTARLDHPNIVTVYSAERTDAYAYYTMKLIDGIDLRRLINLMIETKSSLAGAVWEMEPLANLLLAANNDSDGNNKSTRASTAPQEAESLACGAAFSREVFSFFARQLAAAGDAIAHANKLGVLHRDIKPSNLILDRTGKVYVADFGLAKWNNDSDHDESTACVGTRGYIAPEVLESSSAVDQRSEVFAFGCVLHKLMTLRSKNPPGPSDRSWEDHAKRILPLELFAIIRMAMASDPNDRYPSVQELAADLRRFADEQTVRAAKSLAQVVSPRQTKGLLGGSWVRSAAFVSLMVLCLILAGALYRQSSLAQSQSHRADATVDLLLTSLEDVYQTSGRELISRNRTERPRPTKLSDATIQRLESGSDACRNLLQQRGELEPRHAIKVASLLRKIAVIFDGAGKANRAADEYGWAAAALEGLGDSEPAVVAERCWLRYLETRNRQFTNGFASQRANYERIDHQTMKCLRRPDLNTKTQSRLQEVLGLVAMARQDYGIAIQHLQQVEDPEFGPGSLTKALITSYRMSGRHEQALPLAEQLTEQNAQDDEAWRNLAGLRLHLDQTAEAKAAFHRCVELNPLNALGWQGLAWACFRSGETAEALEFVENACELAPFNDTILVARAKFRLHEDQFEGAISDLRQALRLRPESPYVAYPAILALTFWEGSDDEERDFVEQVIKKHSDKWPRTMALEIKALLEFRSGNFNGALLLEELESSKPLSRLVVLSAKLCLADNELARKRFLVELGDWRNKGWAGLDGSALNRMVRDSILKVCERLTETETTAHSDTLFSS